MWLFGVQFFQSKFYNLFLVIIGHFALYYNIANLSFSQVLSAYEFEQHAGAKTRHPNNHIYLETGRPIYSIIQEIKSAPLSMLDEVIKNVAGSSINEESFRVWKGDHYLSSL